MANRKFYLIVLFIGILITLLAVSNALKCYQCGLYNNGEGSITPCSNYSEHLAHLHLKDCPRATQKYCIKYVSELSTVRDCVEQCTEKEVWGTRTYCCNEDSCNGSHDTKIPSVAILLAPITTFLTTAHLRRH